jgi:hypothetical protein
MPIHYIPDVPLVVELSSLMSLLRTRQLHQFMISPHPKAKSYVWEIGPQAISQIPFFYPPIECTNISKWPQRLPFPNIVLAIPSLVSISTKDGPPTIPSPQNGRNPNDDSHTHSHHTLYTPTH